MLAGTVYFYDHFKLPLLEMDIEDFDEMSNRELFDTILKLDAVKVVIESVSHNHQSNPSETIIFSRRH